MNDLIAEWTRRNRLLLSWLATLALVTLPFVQVVLGTKTAMFSDVNAAHVPRYGAVWDNLRNGDSSFWWGGIFAGHNALGAGQSAIFYPPNILFGIFSPVSAYRCWFFLHVWIMASGFFLWSWRRWRSHAGAVVSGVVGTLNGFVVYHLLHMPFTAALTWVPWILLVVDILLERRDTRMMAALAALIALVSFAGHPQMLWLTLMAVGISSLVGLARRHVDWSALVRIAGAVALGLALCSLQIIPQLRFGTTSVRSEASENYVLDHAASGRHLLTLVAPNVMGGAEAGPGWSTPWLDVESQHENANYLGVTAAALAIIGAIRLRRDRRVIALGAIASFGLLTAVAGHSVLGRFIYEFVPLASNFRLWTRHMVLVNVAVACLAGLGVREVLRQPKTWVSRLVGVALVVQTLLLLLPAVTDLRGSLLRGAEGAAARCMPAILLVLLAGGLGVGLRRKRVAGAMVIAVCVVDLGMFTVSAPWRSQSLSRSGVAARYESPAPELGDVVDRPGGIDRWVNDSSLIWEHMLPSGAPSAIGYDPQLQIDFALTVARLNEGGYPLRNDIWSGGWLPDVLRITTLYARKARPTDQSWTPGGSVLPPYGRWLYTPRLAETYLVGAVRIGNLDDARTGINNPDTRLTEFAYIDTSTVESTEPFAAINAPGISGTVSSGAMDDGGHGRWTVTADRPSIFITSYAWMEGWTATVDGTPVPVARTNGLVLGVPVPAGQHEIRLAFTPPGWTTGRNISITALIIVLLMLATPTPWGQRTITRTRRIVRNRGSATAGEAAPTS